MEDIVFTLEFDDDSANSRANEYLEKGWKLLHVGTKVIEYSNEQFYYITAYVVGANREQYEAYKKEVEENEKNDPFKNLLD